MLMEPNYLAFFPGKPEKRLFGVDEMIIHRRLGYRIVDVPAEAEAEVAKPSSSTPSVPPSPGRSNSSRRPKR